MSDLMREQLGAYLDGELPGPAQKAMQAHLETCQACRAELAALRQLSQTLRTAPLPAALAEADRFAEQLALHLPPRSEQRAALPATRTGWLVPLGLLTGLVFIQATSVLNALVGLAGGQLDAIGAWLTPGSGQTLWLNAAQLVFQNGLSPKALAPLQTANDAVVGLQQWLINPVLWQLVVAVAYLACLAFWWNSHQPSLSHEHVLE